MLEFAGRIERVDIYLQGTGSRDADERDWKRCDVGRHHRDAVALLNAQLGLQIGAEGARQPVDIAERERSAEAAKCNLATIALHRAVEQFHDRRVPVGINLSRNLGVRFRPVPHHPAGVGGASAAHALQQPGPHWLLPINTSSMTYTCLLLVLPARSSLTVAK